MNRCDIVMPVWNQLEMTRKCIESVLEHTDYPYRLIIIDNGSEDKTAEYLKNFSEEHRDFVHLIRVDINEGYIKATNRGMKVSDGDYVCLLSNDTLVYPKWLSSMINVAEEFKDIGLINPVSNHFDYESISDVPHGPNPYIGMGRCIGFCMLIKRELIDKIGFLDERFGLGYGEDDAYSVSAHNEGYRCAMAKRAYVYHYGKKTFGRDKAAREYRNRQRRLAKDILGEGYKIIVFFTEDVSQNMLDLMTKMADKGVRLKIFSPTSLNLDSNHTFIESRRLNRLPLFIMAFYRIIFDRRVRYFATDDFFLFNIFKILSFNRRKVLLLNTERTLNLPGLIYKRDVEAIISRLEQIR